MSRQGVESQRRKNLANPMRLVYQGIAVAVFGIVAVIVSGNPQGYICIPLGALWSLLYFYWKRKAGK